jgi:hypothetical protein
LYQGEDQKDNSGQYGKTNPWSVEILAHKHCMPSRPPTLAKTIHLPTKVCVTIVVHISVMIKLVEELGRIIFNYLILAQNIHVLGRINEVV